MAMFFPVSSPSSLPTTTYAPLRSTSASMLQSSTTSSPAAAADSAQQMLASLASLQAGWQSFSGSGDLGSLSTPLSGQYSGMIDAFDAQLNSAITSYGPMTDFSSASSLSQLGSTSSFNPSSFDLSSFAVSSPGFASDASSSGLFASDTSALLSDDGSFEQEQLAQFEQSNTAPLFTTLGSGDSSAEDDSGSGLI